MPKISSELQAKHELWFRGDLSWKLQPHQLEIYTAIKNKGLEPQNVFVLHAARRLGKSYLLCILAVEKALSQPNLVIKYCASTAKQVREFLVPTINDIMLDAPKSQKPKYNKAELTYRFRNGSVIQLHGLEDGKVELVRGARSDFTVIDEAGFVDNLNYCVKSVLFPMTLTTKGQTILSSNSPLSPSHDFCQVFTPEAIENNSYLKRTVFDNKTLTPEDIERVAKQYGGFESTDFKREFGCEFVVDENTTILPEFSKAKNDIIVPKDKIKVPEFYFPIVTIDLGFNDATAVTFGYFDFLQAKIVIQAELLLHGANSSTLTQRCLQIEESLWPFKSPVRFADGQLYSLNDLTTVHNYVVAPVKKDVLEAQVNSLRLEIQKHSIIISDSCTNLIHQMATATWNKDKTKFARAGSNHQDLLAALIYLVRHIMKHNPYPYNQGFNQDREWRRQDTSTSTENQFRKLFNRKV